MEFFQEIPYLDNNPYDTDYIIGGCTCKTLATLIKLKPAIKPNTIQHCQFLKLIAPVLKCNS